MTRRWPLTAAALALLVLTGCSTEDASARTAPSPTTSSASSSPTSSATPSTSPSTSSTPNTAPADLAVYICTDGIAEPDQLIRDATTAAQAGTRSPAEIVDAFRQAQDMVEALAARSDAAELWFSPSLQDYADALGRMRVSGDGGLDALIEARGAINTSCLIPSPSTT